MGIVADKCAEILVRVIGEPLNAIKPEAHLLDDLGVDSLDSLDLVLHCEEEFGLELSDDEIGKVATFGDLTRLIEGKL